MFTNWDAETQGLLETGQTIEAQGVLISFDGLLILDLSEIHPSASADASDPSQAESATSEESEAASLPEAPETALLEVPLVYSGSHNLPGLCYLGAAGMLVKYEHPSLDFSDVVALSGMGSSALHLNFPEMPSMLISPYKEQSIVFMIQNLSGAFVLGLQKGGTASDPFQPASLPFENHAVKVIEFNNPTEALETLKQVVSSGKPAAVHLNFYHVYDDFAADSDYWRDSASKDHASHYMVVKGYDQDWIYLNDPTDPTSSAGALKASIENFMKAWEDITAIPNSPPRGPFWMFYL